MKHLLTFILAALAAFFVSGCASAETARPADDQIPTMMAFEGDTGVALLEEACPDELAPLLFKSQYHARLKLAIITVGTDGFVGCWIPWSDKPKIHVRYTEGWMDVPVSMLKPVMVPRGGRGT